VTEGLESSSGSGEYRLDVVPSGGTCHTEWSIGVGEVLRTWCWSVGSSRTE
jgi:hypothetical protein